MTEPPNLLGDIPDELPQELVQTLVTTKSFRIERIVSLRHTSPPGFWYDQDTHEWVLLIQGSARLRIEGEEELLEMKPGSYVNLPAHKRHRVEWTDPTKPTIWLAIHYGD
jgi:cupin 2 domain-containing protein